MTLKLPTIDESTMALHLRTGHALPILWPENTCGTCTMCCTILAVGAINKGYRCRCPHEITRKGCAIYNDRPEECRNWSCLYRLGVLPDGLRPDQCNCIIEVQAPDFNSVVIHEAVGYRGAHRSNKLVRGYIKDCLAQHLSVMVISPPDRWLYGPCADEEVWHMNPWMHNPDGSRLALIDHREPMP